jgi:L-alanine-DL-glutamate epimerase-like enolase superfamily enzyme
VPTNGRLAVSDAPGFGLELNPDAALERYRVA